MEWQPRASLGGELMTESRTEGGEEVSHMNSREMTVPRGAGTCELKTLLDYEGFPSFGLPQPHSPMLGSQASQGNWTRTPGTEGRKDISHSFSHPEVSGLLSF